MSMIYRFHPKETYPFIGLIQNDCPSYRNSDLVGSEVLKYVIQMGNIRFQDVTSVEYYNILRKENYAFTKMENIYIHTHTHTHTHIGLAIFFVFKLAKTTQTIIQIFFLFFFDKSKPSYNFLIFRAGGTTNMGFSSLCLEQNTTEIL